MPFDPSIVADPQPASIGAPGPQQPQAQDAPPSLAGLNLDANVSPPSAGGQGPDLSRTYQSPEPMPTSGFGGKLKDMLQRFAYYGGQAALKHVGLPTDDELQMHNTQIQNVQSEIQARAAQTKQMQSMVTLPNGMTMPYGLAQKVFPQYVAGQAKQGVANTQADAKNTATSAGMAKFGYRLNPDTNQPEAIPDAELSPVQRQTMAVQKALQDLNEAKAAGIPQEIRLKAQALQQALQLGNARVGIGQQKNAIDAAKLGIGPLAGQLGGGSDFTDQPQFKVLSPAAQKTLMETVPVHQQIQELMQTFESMKDDNTAGKFFKQRALYSAGIQSPIGNASDAIAQLELNRVTGAARVMKGSSRAIQALEMAMKHLPNVWIDSPKMIYSKLQNLDGALNQIEGGAWNYGSKSGLTPAPNSSTSGGVETKTYQGHTYSRAKGSNDPWKLSAQ